MLHDAAPRVQAAGHDVYQRPRRLHPVITVVSLVVMVGSEGIGLIGIFSGFRGHSTSGLRPDGRAGPAGNGANLAHASLQVGRMGHARPAGETVMQDSQLAELLWG